MLSRVAALLLSLCACMAWAEQGLSPDEIRIGTIQDLSGPIALLGVPIRDGMQMRFDQENAAGGIHGRRIRMVVEDSGYDPKKGVLAARKLLERDRVFAIVGTLGTPLVLATMPLALEREVPHLFPFSPHRDTYEPLHRLKFQIFAPYYDYMRAATLHMLRTKGYKRVGILYQDDDYGLEVLRGVEAALAEAGVALVEKTSYKRGATDFASQIARLRAADADLVILATVVRETVGAAAEARKIGWNVDMLVTASGYSAQVHELGGSNVEGLYGVCVVPHPYAEGANPELAGWIADYRKRFGAEPNVWSVMGYTAADLFVRAARKAGPKLTTESFVAALEQVRTPGDFFGSPEYAFSATDHLGNHHRRLAQIRNGRWVIISDYLR